MKLTESRLRQIIREELLREFKFIKWIRDQVDLDDEAARAIAGLGVEIVVPARTVGDLLNNINAYQKIERKARTMGSAGEEITSKVLKLIISVSSLAGPSGMALSTVVKGGDKAFDKAIDLYKAIKSHVETDQIDWNNPEDYPIASKFNLHPDLAAVIDDNILKKIDEIYERYLQKLDPKTPIESIKSVNDAIVYVSNQRMNDFELKDL